MSRQNGSTPAMPIYLTEAIIRAAENGADEVVDRVSGLTKREMFAMAAMQGLRACTDEVYLAEDLARHSVDYADALLAELEKTK